MPGRQKCASDTEEYDVVTLKSLEFGDLNFTFDPKTIFVLVDKKMSDWLHCDVASCGNVSLLVL